MKGNEANFFWLLCLCEYSEIYPKLWALLDLWFTTHIKTSIFAVDTGRSQSKCSEKGSLHLMCKATILNRINTFPEIDLEVSTKPDVFVNIPYLDYSMPEGVCS